MTKSRLPSLVWAQRLGLFCAAAVALESGCSVNSTGIPVVGHTWDGDAAAVDGSRGETRNATIDGSGDATVHAPTDAEDAASATDAGTGSTTRTATGTGTITVTASGTATVTPTDTTTASATVTRTETSTATATATGTTTATATPTATSTVTATSTGTATATTPDAGVTPDASPPGKLTVSPQALNFGDNGFVACDPTAAPAGSLNLTLSNIGGQPLDWSVSLGRSPSPFSVAPTSGVLAANASVAVTVTPGAIPFPADTTPNAYGDVLTITTTIPADVVHLIKLNQTAQGAILAFQPASSYDLGDVQVGSSASASIQLANSGNAPIDVMLSIAKLTGQADASFSVNLGTSSQLNGIAAATNQAVTIGFAPGGLASDATTASGTLAMSVKSNAVLCAALPGPLALTGTGTVASVTTSPSSQIVFTGPGMTQNGTVFGAPAQGFTYCGTTAAPRMVVFGNGGTAGYAIATATLGQGAGSPYTVSVGNNGDGVGVVNPGKSVSLTLASAPVPSNWNFQTATATFTDALTVTTNAVGDSPHVFSIAQSPYGAVPQNFAPPPTGSTAAFNFPNTAGGGQSSIPMGIANSGNAPATMTFVVTSSGNAPIGTWTFDNATVPPFSSLPDGTTAFSAYFSAPVVPFNTPYSGGTANFTLSNTPLCTTTPPVTKATMKGTATTAQPITVTPTSIMFKAISCGASAPVGVSSTVTIKNSTGAAANWTASIPTNAANNTSFTLSAQSGSVAASATTTFTISPAPIPMDPTVVAPDGGAEYSNMLTVTVGPNIFTIPVTETASGLFIKLPPSVISTAPKPRQVFTAQRFLMQNWGDIGENVTLTMANVSPAQLSLNTIAQLPGTAQITSYINKTGSGGIAGVTDFVINASPVGQIGSASVTVTAPASTPVCWPMPTMVVTSQ